MNPPSLTRGFPHFKGTTPNPQALLPGARRPRRTGQPGEDGDGVHLHPPHAGGAGGSGRAASISPPRRQEAGREGPPPRYHSPPRDRDRGGRSLLQAPQRLPLLPALPLLPLPGRAEAAALAAGLPPCRRQLRLPLPPRLSSARLTYAAILFRPVVLNVNPT